MPSPGPAHNEKGGTGVIGTTSVGSRAEEAGIGTMVTCLSGRLASLTTAEGEEKELVAAKEIEDTSEGLKGGKSKGQGIGSQQNQKTEPPSSLSSASGPTPSTTTAAYAPSSVKTTDHRGRRFAKYERVPPIPGTSTTSRSWRRPVGDRPRGVGDGSGSFAWDKMNTSGLGGGRKRIDSLGAGKAPPDWLWKYLENPREAKIEKMVYHEDDLCIVIYDRFPKAKYHLLLIAKDRPVNQLTDLRREQLPTQRHLHDVGRAISIDLSRQGAGAIRCGYHVIPSVGPLHMHIISQDFDSPHLFKITHWNSFTTDLFVDCSWVEARLEDLGSLEFDKDKYKKLERQPGQCFRCGLPASVMSLKKHNLECASPLPGAATESRGKSV